MRYMALYCAQQSAMDQMSKTTPEERKAGMAKWMAWGEKTGKALLDFGAPLGIGTALTADGDTDRTKELCGYSFIEANDLAAAKALLTDHPHLDWAPSCKIEVYPAKPMPTG